MLHAKECFTITVLVPQMAEWVAFCWVETNGTERVIMCPSGSHQELTAVAYIPEVAGWFGCIPFVSSNDVICHGAAGTEATWAVESTWKP
jgi:hypothetical protein